MPYVSESKEKKSKPTKTEREHTDEDFQLLDEAFEEDGAGTRLSDEEAACSVRATAGSGNNSTSLRQLKAIQKDPSEKSLPARTFNFWSTKLLGKINNKEMSKKNEIVIRDYTFEPIKYDQESFNEMIRIAQTYTPDPDAKGRREKVLQDYETGKKMNNVPEHDHYDSLTFDEQIKLFIHSDTDATTRGGLAGKINKIIKKINAYNTAEAAHSWKLSAKKVVDVILIPQNLYLQGRPGVCLPAVVLMGRALQNGQDTILANKLMDIYSSSDVDADPLYKSLSDLHAKGSASKFSDSLISGVSVSRLLSMESTLFSTENAFVRVDIPNHTMLISRVNKEGKVKYVFFDPNYGLTYFKSYQHMINFFKDKIKEYKFPENQTSFYQLNYSRVLEGDINGRNLDEIINGEIEQSYRQEEGGLQRASEPVKQIRQRGNLNNLCGDLIPEMQTRLPGFPAVNQPDVISGVSERLASVRLNPLYAGELMSGDLLDSVQQDGMLPARLTGTLQGRDMTSTQQLQQLRLLLKDIASRRRFETDVSMFSRAFSLFEKQITYATENRLPALVDALTAMLLDIHPDHIQALCQQKEGGGERYFELLERVSRNEYTSAELCQRMITRLVGTDTKYDGNNRSLVHELMVRNMRTSYFSSDRYTEWPERLWSILYHTACRIDQEQGVNRVIRLMLAEHWCAGPQTSNLYTLLTQDHFGKRFSLPRQLLPTDEQLRSYTGREKISLQKQLAIYREKAPDVLSPVDLLSEAEITLRKILLITDPAQRVKATSAWLLAALNRQDPQLFNTCASALVRPLFSVETFRRTPGETDRKAWLEQLARLAQEPFTSEQVISQILHTLFGTGSVLRSSINSGLAGAALMPLIWRAADDAVNRLDGTRHDIMSHLLTAHYRDTGKLFSSRSGYLGYEALLKNEGLRNTLPREFIPQDTLLEENSLSNKYLKRLREHRTRAPSVAGTPVRSQPDIFLHYYPEGDINDPLASLTANACAATFGAQLQARQDETNARLGAFYTSSLPVAESDFLRNDMVATHRQLLRTDLLLANIWSAEMQEYIPPLVGRLLQCRILIREADGQEYSVGGKGKFSVCLTERQGKGYSATDDDNAPVVGFFEAFLRAMPPEMKQDLINRHILDSPAEDHARQLVYRLSDHISAHPEFTDKVIEETVPADKNELRYLSTLLSRDMTRSSDADLDVRECLYLCARVFHNGTDEDKAGIIRKLLTPAFICAIRKQLKHPGVATVYFGLLDIAFRMPSETVALTVQEGAELYTHLAEGPDALIHALLNSTGFTQTTFDVYFTLLRRAIAAQAHSEGSSEEAVRYHTRMAWLKRRVYKTLPTRHTDFMATLLHSAGLLPTDEEVKTYLRSKDKDWFAFPGRETSEACQRLAKAASKTDAHQRTDGDITSLGLLRYSQKDFHTSRIQAERLSRTENNAIKTIQSAIEAQVKTEVRRQISEQYLAAAKKLEAEYPLLPEARRLAEKLRTDARTPSPERVDRYSKQVARQIFEERRREFIPQIQQRILQHANLLPLAQTYDPEQGAMILPRYADYIASSPAFSSIVSGLLTEAGPEEGIFHHQALRIHHIDSGPVVPAPRLSLFATALSQQMPPYHFSMGAEQEAKQSSTVVSGEPVREKTAVPAKVPSYQTGTHLPTQPALSLPSVARTVSPASIRVNLRDIAREHVEEPATKIAQVRDVHGRISCGMISATVTLPPASGESGSAVRALYPEGNVHTFSHQQDEDLRVPPVFHAGSATRFGAHIVTLSDILPCGTGGRAAEHARGDRAPAHLVRQYFSEVNTILSSAQNPGKLTPENDAIRADVARRTHEVFTPELMTAINARHNVVQEAAREIIHHNNIAIVNSGQYENLIRMEGAPVAARIFSDKMQSGDCEASETTAQNIAQNAPVWREELRAEQEAKYLEARRKAEEEERKRQEEKRSEEQGVKQEEKRSAEHDVKQEEKRGEKEKNGHRQPAAVKERVR